MKKILITLLLLSLNNYIYSQIGIKGGLNLSSVNSDYYDSSYGLGFQVGGFYDVALSEKFVFQPQLLFVHNSFKRKDLVLHDNMIYKDHTNSYGLSLPLLISYRYPISTKSKIMLDFGPFISYGLFGKIKKDVWEGDKLINSQKNNVYNDNRSPVDVGLMGGLGFQSKEYILSFHYKHGLHKGTSDDLTMSFMFSVGYRFNK